MRFFALMLLSYSMSVSAQVFIGPTASSLGGAGRAGLTGSESVFLNPALLPLVQSTEIVGYFRDGQQGRGRHVNAWGVGAVDASRDVYFPASIHYLRLRDTGRASGPVNGEIYHLAMGKNVSDRLAVGVSGYRLQSAVEGDRTYTQWNASLGLLVLVSDKMGFAYVLNHLAGPGSEVPAGLRQDMNQGVGFYGAIADMARLRFDITRAERFNPDKKMTYMVGLESMVNDYFLFRMGFRREELADQRFYTAGFGFNGPRLKMNYGFEKNTRGTEGAVHSVDMRVPF